MIPNDDNSSVKKVKDIIAESEQKKIVNNQADFNAEYTYLQKMHEHQQLRTAEITKILQNYASQQKERHNDKQKKKKHIFIALLILIFAIVFALFAWSIVFICLHEIDGSGVAVLISGFVTCLGSVLSILLIIVKYLFPKNEDENFNSLVKFIIENDTKRIKDENDFNIERKK